MVEAYNHRTGNIERVVTSHKTFNKQTNFIGRGDVDATTMFGIAIDGESFDRTMRQFKAAGFYPRMDIRDEVAKILEYRPVHLYAFFTYYTKHVKGKDKRVKRVVHGFIMTDMAHNFLNMWVTGPTTDSYSLMTDIVDYVARKGA